MAKAKPTATHALEPVFTAIGKDIGVINRNTTETNDLLQQILAKVGGNSHDITPVPEPQPRTPPTSTEKVETPTEKWLAATLNSLKGISVYRYCTEECEVLGGLALSLSLKTPPHLIGQPALVRYASYPLDGDEALKFKTVESLDSAIELDYAVGNGYYLMVELIVAEAIAEAEIKQYPPLEVEWLE